MTDSLPSNPSDDDAFEKLLAVHGDAAYTAGASGGHSGRLEMIAIFKSIMEAWRAKSAELALARKEIERLNMEMQSYRAQLTHADAKAMAAVIEALWKAKHPDIEPDEREDPCHPDYVGQVEPSLQSTYSADVSIKSGKLNTPDEPAASLSPQWSHEDHVRMLRNPRAAITTALAYLTGDPPMVDSAIERLREADVTITADETSGQCQHDLLRLGTTIQVIDPWKAKCKVCIEFFDLPGPLSSPAETSERLPLLEGLRGSGTDSATLELYYENRLQAFDAQVYLTQLMTAES